MFAQCSSLTSLDLSSFNTSKVTDMRGLFEGCKKLTSLNVSSFNTSNVKYMDGMFKDCSSLTSLDLTNFNTSNVVSMGTVHRFFYNWGSAGQYGNYRYEANGGMFENCTGLTSLDLSNSNTSNVTRMYKMFYNCTHLTYLNLSIFDMSHLEVIDYDYTYTGKEGMCWKLASASGSCTIVCTESVQNSLLNGTSIPAGQVTFTWVRP
jgi:surface protein